MNRKEAIEMIQTVWKGEKDEAQAERYLERMIDLCEPEYDDLKTETGTVGGNKREHFHKQISTFYQNEHGGF